jgi:hypothetical protein
LDLNNGDAAAAKAKFEIAKDEMGRRDYSEYVYIARAYMNAANQILKLLFKH